MQATSHSCTSDFWCEMWRFRVKCEELKGDKKTPSCDHRFLEQQRASVCLWRHSAKWKFPAWQFHTDYMLPFINPCFWTWGASQQIFYHTPLCIYYVILRPVALHSSGTPHNIGWSRADSNWGLRPAAILRTTRSHLFPYLQSHHNVPFHTTFC